MNNNKMFNENNFDLSVSPSEDFNLFVNGKWMEKNDIPSKYTRWGTFEILHEENLQKIKNIIENSDGYYEKLKIYYDIACDENKLNAEKDEPLKPLLSTLDKINSKDGLWLFICSIYPKGLINLFHFSPETDAKDSENVAPYLSSSGLGLPDRDYYFDSDKNEIRNKYIQFKKDILKLYNKNGSEDSLVDEVFNLEKDLAQKTFTRVEKRDPSKNYNKMNFQELNEMCNFNWMVFYNIIMGNNEPPFNNLHLPFVIVDNPGYFIELKKLWDTVSIDVWKVLLKLNIIVSCSSYLSTDYVDLKFNFYNKTLSGQKEIKPRWERAISMINSDLGELVGRKYVEKHFTSEAKEKMLDMVNRLNIELKKRLLNLSWMSEDTKKKALKKNDAFTAKIGYPDEWRDYSDLEINREMSLLAITLRCTEYEHYYEMKRLFKPTDHNRWEMDPHTINAYFHPLKNEIVFPAGILQAPFFDVNSEDAFNYGAIGTVIGHEMTHSYDDMGRQFDHEGNLNNWWNEDDLSKFNEKSQYFVDEFGSFKSNDKNLNGKLTLGENLADHGGVKISFHAFLNKLGKTYDTSTYSSFKIPSNYISLESLSPEQKFFISWAQIWKNNITKEELDKRIMTDPHSPGEWRINGTLANIPEFHKTFDIQPGSKMYRENPTQMW